MMTTFLLSVLLVVATDAGNPLIPDYPFETARITYRRTSDHKAVAYVSGKKVFFQIIETKRGKPVRTLTTFTDGKFVYRLEESSSGSSMKKEPHPGAYLTEDFARLDPTERDRFLKARGDFWDAYSPVFNHNFFGATGSAFSVKRETGRTVRRTIARHECDVFSVGGTRYWRLKDTDLILRGKTRPMELNAQKIETGVQVPESLLKLIPEETSPLPNDVEPRLAAQRAFRQLAGKEAAPMPTDTLLLRGQKIRLQDLELIWTRTPKGDPPYPSLGFTVRSIVGPWTFSISCSPPHATTFEELTKRAIPLAPHQVILLNRDSRQMYRAVALKLRIRSASPEKITISLSGQWETTGRVKTALRGVDLEPRLKFESDMSGFYFTALKK